MRLRLILKVRGGWSTNFTLIGGASGASAPGPSGGRLVPRPDSLPIWSGASSNLLGYSGVDVSCILSMQIWHVDLLCSYSDDPPVEIDNHENLWITVSDNPISTRCFMYRFTYMSTWWLKLGFIYRQQGSSKIGPCFKCNKTRHLANKCPKKEQPNQPQQQAPHVKVNHVVAKEA